MFEETIKELPFNPRTTTGSGFLPPIFRASMHLLYLLACHADEAIEVTDEQAIDTLKQAQEHWNARTTPPSISTGCATRAATISTAIGEAITEYPTWNTDAKTSNIRDLCHRIAQLAADLDRELTGIRDSDPGRTL